MSVVLSFDKVRLGYGKNVVISDLSFEVLDRDFLCVVGPNGSGKTTLINGILGFLKPMSGKITWIALRKKK